MVVVGWGPCTGPPWGKHSLCPPALGLEASVVVPLALARVANIGLPSRWISLICCPLWVSRGPDYHCFLAFARGLGSEGQHKHSP